MPFQGEKPIFLQLAEQLEAGILSGAYPEGSQDLHRAPGIAIGRLLDDGPQAVGHKEIVDKFFFQLVQIRSHRRASSIGQSSVLHFTLSFPPCQCRFPVDNIRPLCYISLTVN